MQRMSKAVLNAMLKHSANELLLLRGAEGCRRNGAKPGSGLRNVEGYHRRGLQN